MKEKYILLLLAIFSGVLYWLSYSYTLLWPLMLVAFVPMLYIIDRPGISYRKIFFLGELMGFTASAGVAFWYWSMLPLDWVGISSPTMQWLAVLYAWLVASAVGTVFGALLVTTYAWLKRNTWFDILLFPALGVSFSFIRSVAASIFLYGNGGVIGPHWTLGSNGYALASSSILLPLAAIGGVYLLGFAAFLVNGLLYRIAVLVVEKKNWARPAQVLVGLCIAAVVFSAMYYQVLDRNTPIVKVAVANTY